MTLVKTYSEQLQISAAILRLQIPEVISKAVVDRINLIQSSLILTFPLPENIIYASSIDETKFHSETHITRVKISGWKLEILKAEKGSTGEEVIIALINKIGSIRTKIAASDHRNGNNSLRQKKIRR